MKKNIKTTLLILATISISNLSFGQFTGTCPETSTCNVGIGTSTPSAKLTIFQDQSFLSMPGSTFSNPFEINRRVLSGMSTITQSMFTLTPTGRIGIFNGNPSSLFHINAPNIAYPSFEITKNFGTSVSQIITEPMNYTLSQLSQSSLLAQKDASIIFSDNANGNNVSASLVIAPRMSSNAGGIKIGSTGDLSVINSELILNNSRLVINDGTTNQFQITANGLVAARQIDVHLDPIPDFVFHSAFDADSAAYYAETGQYKAMTLAEVDTFVQVNRHLPGIKSAAEYEQAGSINVGELQLQLLQKVEELTLYNIELMKQLEALKQKQILLEQQLKSNSK